MRANKPTILLTIALTALSKVTQAQQFVGSEWPSLAEWQSLNSSLGGRLQTLRPWAAVCYSSDPLFNSTRCQQVLSDYGNDTIRALQPSSLQWPAFEACGKGQGCGLNVSNPQIIDGATCNQGTIPSYSVSITNAQEASTVVRWAVANNMILTVKSTGHDLTGRSAAPGTLQVNVAQLQNMEYIPQFVPEGSQDPPVSAITVGGGVHMIDIYKLAERENVSVVLATCETLGAGGFFQAGGHGPLTPSLGLGIDNVLEYEIITADGTIRKINAAQDPVLFWAVRGGGAGSWGIITSVTIQTYPNMRVGGSVLLIRPNPAQNASELAIQFITLLGKYQNVWIDAGMSTSLLLNDTYTTNFLWPSTNDSLPLLFPFFDELNSLSANYTVITNETAVPMFNSYTEEEMAIGPLADADGYPGAYLQMSSRLIPRSFLTSSNSIRKVAEAIWAGYESMVAVFADSGNPGNFVVPPIVAGNMPGGRHLHRINETGGNPALYEASWMVTYAAVWDVVSDETYPEYISAVAHCVDPLTEMGIVGSYQGEGNVNEVNWQESFFGYKYSNLTNIKRRYDPTNFFNSWKGVDFVEDRSSYRCYQQNRLNATQT